MALEDYHRCHAIGCDTHVPPKMFMCKRHWYELLKVDRDLIWQLYRPGQEDDKKPSAAYVSAAGRIIRDQAIRAGLLEPRAEIRLEDI